MYKRGCGRMKVEMVAGGEAKCAMVLQMDKKGVCAVFFSPSLTVSRSSSLRIKQGGTGGSHVGQEGGGGAAAGAGGDSGS